MNIRDTSQIVKQVYPNLMLNVKFDYGKDKGSVSGIKVTKEAIRILHQNELFTEQVDPLWSDFFVSKTTDQTEIDGNQRRLVETNYNYLKIAIEALHKTLSEVFLDEFENSVRIKLPPTNDFSELSKISNELNKSISIPISHKNIDGNTSIKSVENGSIWFVVVVASPLAVGLVGGIAWASAVIHKKKQEGKIFEEHVKSLELANEQKEVFLDAQKKQLELLIETESKALNDEYYKESNNEDLERLKHSIVTISSLINKGLEIHPSLNTPEDVSNLFPDFKKLNLIESKTKLIGDHKVA
ncbi:hypothetical protein N7E81_16745 [Reichenbachiella carrageenanivorans]|uniref:Uncharacterized protein n=1 Tax=Reichenbachiella carrageenanivorans TaxID=2979869 RepID=A0ABY6CYL0_9BACT|nr:hypothetical protein [Reichenbachiella carrageenanivorans]UXX79004.1 hypothetical protein N7E81_16745 [Reichenbachiella carrageenanivorans]